VDPLEPYKACPECRSEYRLEVLRCVDCDVELVHISELPPEGPDALADFPPASELECVRVAPLAWIRALSDALQEAGVPHRVQPARAEDAPEGQRPDIFGDVGLFGLYLRAEDLEPARELDGLISARLLPEEAPDLADGEDDACPACGTLLSPEAVECPDCGLQFG